MTHNLKIHTCEPKPYTDLERKEDDKYYYYSQAQKRIKKDGTEVWYVNYRKKLKGTKGHGKRGPDKKKRKTRVKKKNVTKKKLLDQSINVLRKMDEEDLRNFLIIRTPS